MWKRTDENAPRQGNSTPLIDLGFHSTRTESTEQAITRFLESLEPGDPQILELLIDRYAPEIYRLVGTLFDCLDEKRKRPQPAEINAVVQQVFIDAALNFEQSRGEGSARVWLSKIALDTVRAYRRKRWRRVGRIARNRRLPTTHSEIRQSQTKIEQRYWAAILGLTQKQRLCVVLRYAHDLSIPHIAHVLNVSDAQVRTCLISARHVIQQSVAGLDEQPKAEQADVHPEISQQIQAALDGFLDSGYARIHLDRHLATCPACQAHADSARRLVSGITKTLQARWPASALAPSDVGQLAAAARTRLRPASLSKRFRVQVREFGLLGVMLVVVMAMLWSFERGSTRQTEPLFRPTLAPAPTPVESSSVTVTGDYSQEEQTEDEFGQIIAEPCISADGSVVAFTSSADTLVDGDTNEAFDVFVVERQTNRVELISVSSDGEPGNSSSASPRLSADGRWVVFISLADNLVAGDEQTCVREDETVSCIDIFVHDRETGVTERITQARDGSEADGHSMTPSISADGRWIAYWSGASNLAEGDVQVCKVEGTLESVRNCLDVFVYDRESGETERIPIGRSQTGQMKNLIGISDDGRYLSLTVYADDLVAGQVQLTNQVDVFVYDRQTGNFEPVNVSGEGEPGNGSSANSSTSSDGRYVAFASEADNLVADDTNNQIDVFVRDRVAGVTERVSITNDGEEANSDSGTLVFTGIASWGEQISISDDGRYVAFASFADNLVPSRASPNNPYQWPGYNNVYAYDRQIDMIESVGFAGPETDGFYMYVNISGDGRWVSMIEQLPECGLLDVCSVLWLYDQRMDQVEKPLGGKLFAGRGAWASRPYLSLWHDSSVNRVAFAPDGQIVATGTSDGIVRLWRVSDGMLLHVLEKHTRPVSGIAFSQDGALLISGSRDRNVNVWRVADGTLLDQIVERSSGIFSLAVSPDDRLLALGGHEAVWVWRVNAESFTRVDFQRYPDSYVHSVVFSPDSTLLALAPTDNTVWLRRVSDGKTVLRLGNHTGRVLSLAFSPDGKYLATGSVDNTLNLWRLNQNADGEFEATLVFTLEHPDWVKSLAFSPDGTVLASAAMDKSVRLWSIPDGHMLNPPLRTMQQVVRVSFSPDGRTLAVGTGGGNLHLWRVSEPLNSD